MTDKTSPAESKAHHPERTEGADGVARGARKPIDAAALKAVTDAMPHQEEGAGEFVRRMRDEDRY